MFLIMKGMKWKKTFKHCIFREKYGKVILGMQFVGIFIVQMMTKKVILGILKSWDVSFATIVLFMLLI